MPNPTSAAGGAAPSRQSRLDNLLPPDQKRYRDSSTSSGGFSSPIHLSQLSSRQQSASRTPSPPGLPTGLEDSRTEEEEILKPHNSSEEDGEDDWNAWDEETSLQPGDAGYDPDKMPSDMRPPYSRPTDGKSQSGQPLLGTPSHSGYEGGPTLPTSRLSTRKSTTFRERDPHEQAKNTTKTRYTYAAAFLLLSLVSFAIQTETAVYIQHDLGWKKAYCMLYANPPDKPTRAIFERRMLIFGLILAG